MRCIIIGAGVAGIAAIEAIRSVNPFPEGRRQGEDGEIVMISDDPHGFYSHPGHVNFLTGELHDKMLFPRTREDNQRLNFTYQTGRVTKILPVERAIELDSKAHLMYDKLLIAVGAQAVPLTILGASLEPLVKLDNLEDARKILKFAKRGKTVVVVGGGITALELTEGLLARGVKVHYLLQGDRYWGSVLDEYESHIVEHRLQEEGVTLHFHTELTEILGRRRVNGIRTQDERTIRCDIVAYAIGIKPRIELAREAGLSVERGVMTNEYMQTSNEYIYAAGDVVQVYEPSTGRSVLDSLWHLACDQGRAAGLNMAGERQVYIRNLPFNVTRLAGLTTTIIEAVGHGRDEDVVADYWSRYKAN